MSNAETPTHITASLQLGLPVPDGAACVVFAVRGRETVNQPFRYEVDIRTNGLSPNDLRGAPAELVVGDDRGQSLIITGRVQRVEMAVVAALRAEDDDLPYRLLIVPDVFLTLSHRHNSRIFQDQSVPDIVRAICAESGVSASGFSWEQVTATYPARSYCVQYDETDWDFISRLLEQEGIFFGFERNDAETVMVFADHLDGHKAPKQTLSFAYDDSWTTDHACVWDWHESARLTPSKIALDDYDREDPRKDLRISQQVGQQPEREWYEFPGNYLDHGDGKRVGAVRLHENRHHHRTARAQTNDLALRAGQFFMAVGHPTENKSYFVETISLTARIDVDLIEGPLIDAGRPTFNRRLVAVPAQLPYAPPRRIPRPQIAGFQTARVTGPAGAEIHCDALGRIKVQFPWDRVGQLDDHSSCWLRVCQAHTTGSVAIPRVGWEVIVEFENGDPDRPVCMGRLWNPFFPPPTLLPNGKAEMHFSSASSPGGGGANRVRMDDSAGSESVLIAGHRDVLMVTGNDKKLTVGGDRSHKVGANRKVTILGNETIEVQGNLQAHVGGQHDVKVGTRQVAVAGSSSEDIVGDFTLTVGGLENIQVGNPAQAILDTVKAMALEAAKGAAAGLVNQAQAALLSPLSPVLNKAKAALGPAANVAGPAAALLGPTPNPAAVMGLFGHAPQALAAAGPLGDAALLPAGFAVAATSGGALSKNAAPDGFKPAGSAASAGATSSADPTPNASPPAGGGGAGGGGGPSGPTGGGTGTYAVVAKGNVKETVGGLFAINAGLGISIGIGGNSTETIGAARIEAIAGGKQEVTGNSKAETVGSYLVNVSKGMAVSAEAAIGLNIGGTQRQTISGGHSIQSDGPVKIQSPKLKLEGSGAITLTCGSCKVVISSNGVKIDGASTVTVSADKITLDENAIA